MEKCPPDLLRPKVIFEIDIHAVTRMNSLLVPVNKRDQQAWRHDYRSQRKKPERWIDKIARAILRKKANLPDEIWHTGIVTDLDEAEIVYGRMIADQPSAEIVELRFAKDS